MILKTLLVAVYLAATPTLLAQCDGSSERHRVERALARHAAKADPEAGKIRAVDCSPSGRYRGRMVYFCEVRHRDVIVDWCASIGNGKLLTQDQGIPCAGPGGPNRNPLPG